MPFETINNVEAPDQNIDACLDQVWEYSMEVSWIKEILPSVDGKQAYVMTSLIENVCKWNNEANRILNTQV